MYLALLTLLVSQVVDANNITISDFMPADGLQMAASPVACASVETQVYHEAGTVTVSFTTDYEIADAGNLLGFTDAGQGIADVVINVYEDSFDPTDPGLNRIAVVDEGAIVALQAGHSYLLVLQAYCEDTEGVFGIVLRGAGIISGAGFPSAEFTSGEHTPQDAIADFPLDIGVHAYHVSEPVQVPRTGIYYFGEVGINFNAGISLLVYEGSFNPGDTSDNLVASASYTGGLLLERTKTYRFVSVDQDDLEGNWQYALFPPGPMRFNESLKGAWTTPGVEGSGVMMEIGTQTGILFFAWFTFPEEDSISIESDPKTSTRAIGSSDQRWLTGFGFIPPDSNKMNIQYENTTGGFFNQEFPVPVTDSNYGTGTVEVSNCAHLEITYDLPGGVVGTAPMIRTLPDGEIECLESVNAGPIVP
jgi:hypothetical protein